MSGIENQLSDHERKSEGMLVVQASCGTVEANQKIEQEGWEVSVVGAERAGKDMEVELPQRLDDRPSLQPLNTNLPGDRGNKAYKTHSRTEGKWKWVVRQDSGEKRVTRFDNKENKDKKGTKRVMQGAVDMEHKTGTTR